MSHDIEKHSITDRDAPEVDATKVAGGTDGLSTDTEINVIPLYDSLVETTSAAIERVMTVAKTF